jgi:hypothetical protein
LQRQQHGKQTRSHTYSIQRLFWIRLQLYKHIPDIRAQRLRPPLNIYCPASLVEPDPALSEQARLQQLCTTNLDVKHRVSTCTTSDIMASSQAAADAELDQFMNDGGYGASEEPVTEQANDVPNRKRKVAQNDDVSRANNFSVLH